jgi:four helix bundle protein
LTPDELKARTRTFALDCIRLVRTLPRDEASRVMAKQLIRCATSVGANYRAACLAKAIADMVNKLKIVEEEVDETRYWLGLLRDSNTASAEAIAPLDNEADQLFRIVVASVKTLRKRQS